MSDYARMVSSQLKWTLFLLVAIAIGAGITPYTRVFLGLLLGGLVSLFNLWLLQRKVNAFGKAVSEKGKAMSLGTFTRVLDRKSTRLNSSHVAISYAVFCLKNKNKN